MNLHRIINFVDMPEGGLFPKGFIATGKIDSVPKIRERYLIIGNLFIAWGKYNFVRYTTRYRFFKRP